MGFEDPLYWQGLRTQRDLGDWMNYATKLEEQILVLQQDVKIARAHSAGQKAQLLALRSVVEQAGDPSGLFQKVDEKFKSGNSIGKNKTHLSKVYDAAFDQEAKNQGIKDPQSKRS
ncbi:hypothetical protein [Insolitispirillum peregrinum]|uniref:hypothetical protein n=1 Tax=Insolitispirillum peregrinum TaxID=80876 RepID=UPI003610F76C